MKRWPWLLYGFFITNIVVSSFWELISKGSSFQSFYTILIAFNKWYYLTLTFNAIAIGVNLIVPAIVFLYAFDVKTPQKIWKILFWVRIGLDLTGHFYDFQFMKSAFYQSTPYGLAAIGVFVIPFVPSYLAHFLYAFKTPGTKS